MMDLGQLRSFAEVAERGTIAAAAAAMGYTAPAISQHVAKLETELGTPLFDRAGGRLRLSNAGMSLLPIAMAMLDLESRGRQVTRRPPEMPHFVIAGFASALSHVVVPKLNDLRAEMTLEIVEAEDADAMRELSLGTVDVVLTQEYDGIPEQRPERFTFTPLITDRLRLVLPAGMPSSTDVSQLGGTAWLVNGNGTRCAHATQEILRGAQIDPPIAGKVADNRTLLDLVAAGVGVTIVPELLLGDSRSDVVVADQDLGISRAILAVTRRISNETTAVLIDKLLKRSAGGQP